MADQRTPRDPFDPDSPTEYIGGGPGSRGGEDGAPTEYLGAERPGETRAAWGATAAGAGGTRAGSGGSGQYWAPLTPEEAGYADEDFAGGGAQPQPGYAEPAAAAPVRSRGGGRPGVVAIVGIVAIVAVVALIIWFFAGREDAAPAPEPTTTSAPPPSSTEPAEPSTEITNQIQDQIDGLRDEVESLRENPPAIPGVPGGEVTEQTIPEAEGKSPAQVELNLRRLGFSDITVVDADGTEVNSLVAATSTVDSIDPPTGSSVPTDQPITIYLR